MGRESTPEQQGLDTLRRGPAVQANPHDFWAWLQLYLVVDTDEYKRVCLERALAIEPGNEGARWLLARLEA